MKKIVITWPDFFPGEDMAIRSLLESDQVWRLHLRKKRMASLSFTSANSTEGKLRQLIETIPEGLRHKVSIHGYFNLAEEYRLGGIHFSVAGASIPPGWKGLVSRSLHSVEEIGKSEYDYAFLSPIFPSISKPGYKGSFEMEDLKTHVNEKIIALGGIDDKTSVIAANIGFGGVAVLGDVWRARIEAKDFALQFITHPTICHTMAEGARFALDGGCRWIQLRHKDAAEDTLINEGEEIGRLCREYNAMFIVDDHVHLVHRLKAHGVHLGKNDMPVAEARSVLGPQKIIGATANTFDDIRSAWLSGADYIGLGPFRFTTTKSNLSPVLGIQGYLEIINRCRAEGINLPIVAIGGITCDDIPGIMATGANGIAISSEILKASNPTGKTENIINTIKKCLD